MYEYARVVQANVNVTYGKKAAAIANCNSQKNLLIFFALTLSTRLSSVLLLLLPLRYIVTVKLGSEE